MSRKSACSFLVSMLVERARHFLYLNSQSEGALDKNISEILRETLSHLIGSLVERRRNRRGVTSHKSCASFDNFSPTPYLDNTKHSWEGIQTLSWSQIESRIWIKVSNLFVRTPFFTAWSTKRSTALPIDATVDSFGFYGNPYNQIVFLKPASVAMGRKVAAKAHWYPLLARKFFSKEFCNKPLVQIGFSVCMSHPDLLCWSEH